MHKDCLFCNRKKIVNTSVEMAKNISVEDIRVVATANELFFHLIEAVRATCPIKKVKCHDKLVSQQNH